MDKETLHAIDLFAGCGGLSEGMRQAGFDIVAAVEIDQDATECYKLNHPGVRLIQKDIRKVKCAEIKRILNNRTLHLLAACPPCQGFSSVRRLNKRKTVRDKRNMLIHEFYRFVRSLKPLTIMLENVPALKNYRPFKTIVKKLIELGYEIDYSTIALQKYGIPQRRKRLVLIGSRVEKIAIAISPNIKKTVRDFIGDLGSVECTADPLHKIVAKHTDRIQEMIEKVPKDGGSRTDLPEEYVLKCHQKVGVGFNDIYGRLRWDDVASTITGGCLNPSKGRFLHPEQNRCITAREAALLQTFPADYKFPTDMSKTSLAILIGNALPPEFSKIQSLNIIQHLEKHPIV
jgi:DNA (cytosine-5)-methyltransferase 1